MKMLSPAAKDFFLYKDTHAALAPPFREIRDKGALSPMEKEVEHAGRLATEETSRELSYYIEKKLLKGQSTHWLPLNKDSVGRC